MGDIIVYITIAVVVLWLVRRYYLQAASSSKANGCEDCTCSCDTSGNCDDNQNSLKGK